MSTSTTVRLVILGGGGHARVLIDCLAAEGNDLPMGLLDPDPGLWGKEMSGVPVVGGDELLSELVRQGATHFVIGLGGVGDNEPRQRLFELASDSGLTPLAVRHPSAVCSPWSSVGPGTVVFPSAVVNANAVLGVNVIVNTGAIVEHDCAVGDHVHLATGSRLCGDVKVETGAHIGAGATVRQGISVGRGAVVGAGAVVIKDVEPRTVVAGVPARPLEPALADKANPIS